jgi:hypothetical protein
LGINPNINIKKWLSAWTFLGIAHQESDSFGANSFASNSYNLRADAGPYSGGYAPRAFFGGFTAKPGWDIELNVFAAVRSHNYFNITTGQDNNGDTIYNDRPAFATDLTRSSVVRTKFGNFDTNPIAGQTIIPYDYGNAPGQEYTELNFTKNFRFGPRPEAPGPPPGAAAPPDAPAPGKPVAKADLPPPRYRLLFAASADNALNHPNPAAPIGVLTSPQFGKSIALANFFGGNPAANRILTFRSAFFF